jgi:hypothetical protein
MINRSCIQTIHNPSWLLVYAMIKTFYLIFLVCFCASCFAQTSDAYYGVTLTQISTDDTELDTARLLYIQNGAGDRLSVYTIRNGLVFEANAYQLSARSKGLFLYRNPLISGQLTKDSLSLVFQDKAHTVLINGTDRYILFPASYTRFKQEVQVRHSIKTVLNLLSDAIGDYPIADALPLLCYTPSLGRQIYQASIVTQRSQADIKDHWSCHFYYNAKHQLDSVIASSPEETRFHKKVRYSGADVTSIRTYRTGESRQTTDWTITYNKKNNSLLRLNESVYETGKDLETVSLVTLTRHDLGMRHKMELSTAEVLKLLKSTPTHEYTKKHID